MSRQEVEFAPSIVVIAGPTASGKSGLAMQLASRFDADILSADSRQIYRYMDIGTAKPSPADQVSVRHFMLDLIPPDQSYSAHLYRTEGLAVLRRLGHLKRTALVVGGTGFYIRSLLDGLPLPPVPPNPALRLKLTAEAKNHGVVALHERLKKLDPVSARRIHANNLPRVIRALEVVNSLSGPVPQNAVQERIPALYLGVSLKQQVLRERIDKRVLDQVESGLVAETKMLLDMGYQPDAPSLQGFGYRQMIQYLNGDLSLDGAISEYQTATRQYARRQLTWFRSDPRIQWLDGEKHPFEEAVLQIAQFKAKTSLESV